MTTKEALDKINTMFLAYAPRDIREDKELNEDLFECIKSALKEHEMMKQTRIIVGCKNINDDDIEKLKNDRYELIENAIDKLGQLEDIEEKHNIKSVEDLDKRLTVLEIITKYPKSHDSINYVLYMMKYWENENKTITKQLLETYDLPYEVEEYYLLKEYFNEKD